MAAQSPRVKHIRVLAILSLSPISSPSPFISLLPPFQSLLSLSFQSISFTSTILLFIKGVIVDIRLDNNRVRTESNLQSMISSSLLLGEYLE